MSIDTRHFYLIDVTNILVNTIILTWTHPYRIEIDDWIDKVPRSHLLECWKERDLYIDYSESNEHLRENEDEYKELKSMLNNESYFCQSRKASNEIQNEL
jgi:hypothetical protein